MSVDRHAREKAAYLLNLIVENKITNWDLENQWPKSDKDPCINCIAYWIWHLYDDNKNELIQVDEPDLLIIRRCISFLETDIEYKKIEVPFISKIIWKIKNGMEWDPGCELGMQNENWPYP